LGSTRPAVQPVSNPECLITAATCEYATCRGSKRVEIHLQARRFRCRNNACEAGIRDDVIKDKRVCSVGGGLRAAIGEAIGRKSFADGDVAGEVVVDAAADDEIAGKKLRLADEILSGEARGNGECSKRGRRDKARRDAAERKGHNIPPWVVGETQMYLEAGAVDAAT
jgi:hypothetical protein